MCEETDDVKNVWICSLHFRPEDFLPTSSDKMRRIKRDAVPCLNVPETKQFSLTSRRKYTTANRNFSVLSVTDVSNEDNSETNTINPEFEFVISTQIHNADGFDQNFFDETNVKIKEEPMSVIEQHVQMADEDFIVDVVKQEVLEVDESDNMVKDENLTLTNTKDCEDFGE